MQLAKDRDFSAVNDRGSYLNRLLHTLLLRFLKGATGDSLSWPELKGKPIGVGDLLNGSEKTGGPDAGIGKNQAPSDRKNN